MAQNVKFIRGNTATISGTAITDGQLLYNTTTGQHYIDNESTRVEVGKPVDTALSITSTNAIANNAITTSIVNTTAEVSAITANNIPCGTKPVKELNTNLNVVETEVANKLKWHLVGMSSVAAGTDFAFDETQFDEIMVVAFRRMGGVYTEPRNQLGSAIYPIENYTIGSTLTTVRDVSNLATVTRVSATTAKVGYATNGTVEGAVMYAR